MVGLRSLPDPHHHAKVVSCNSSGAAMHGLEAKLRENPLLRACVLADTRDHKHMGLANAPEGLLRPATQPDLVGGGRGSKLRLEMQVREQRRINEIRRYVPRPQTAPAENPHNSMIPAGCSGRLCGEDRYDWPSRGLRGMISLGI